MISLYVIARRGEEHYVTKACLRRGEVAHAYVYEAEAKYPPVEGRYAVAVKMAGGEGFVACGEYGLFAYRKSAYELIDRLTEVCRCGA